MKYILAILLITLSPVALSQEFYKEGKITKVMADDGLHGACMVQIDTSIGNNCHGAWVSLDCSGIYSSPETGKRKLAIALTGFSAKANAKIKIDNEKIIGSFCVATRIDVIQP